MLIPELKKYGFKIAATSLDGDTLYRDADISESTALVIGNEGNGVGNEFLEAADLKIKIPMMGSIESLNAAVAAGILMYQSNKIKQMRGNGNASSVEQNFGRSKRTA